MGYNYQIGSFVLGGEADLNLSDISGEDGAFQLPYTITDQVALDLRAGYAAGNFLPYVTVGAVDGSYVSDHAGNGDPADYATGSLNGVSYGVGVDYKVNDTNFVRVEVLQTTFEAETFEYYVGDFHDMDEAKIMSISIGYAMQF